MKIKCPDGCTGVSVECVQYDAVDGFLHDVNPSHATVLFERFEGFSIAETDATDAPVTPDATPDATSDATTVATTTEGGAGGHVDVAALAASQEGAGQAEGGTDFNAMTVAQLTAWLDTKGVTPPKDARKADLVALATAQ